MQLKLGEKIVEAENLTKNLKSLSKKYTNLKRELENKVF